MRDYLAQVAALSPQRRELLKQWLRARCLLGRESGRGPNLLIPLRPRGHLLPLFCIHPAGGQLVAYYPLIAALNAAQPVYGLQSRALGGEFPEHDSLWEMAAEYTRAIRGQQSEGPYRLLGWSMGGVLAHAIAWLLEQQGQEVTFVGLVDAQLTVGSAPMDPLLGPALALGSDFTERFLALDEEEQNNHRQQLSSLPPEERLQYAINWGRQQGLLSRRPTESTLQVLSQRVALVERHEGLLRSHTPHPIHAPLSIWWASESLEGGRPRTDWNHSTASFVREQVLTGHHFNIVQHPRCLALATQLEEQLTGRLEGMPVPTPEQAITHHT